MTEVEALYEQSGDAFIATPLTTGPWDPNAQSGGAVLSLLGHVLDDGPEETSGFSLSRLTVDLVRPAPVGQRLWVDVDVLHADELTQTLDVTVRSASEVTTRGRARLVRRSTSADGSAPALPVSPPDDLVDVGLREEAPPFLKLGAELRRSDQPAGGTHTVWCRLRVPVVAGEAIRPTSRAVLPFDLVNKIGSSLERDRASTINPDVSGHIARLPVGEWVRLTGNSYYDHQVGHGISMATLSDDLGDFGVTSTSQLVEPMDA